MTKDIIKFNELVDYKIRFRTSKLIRKHRRLVALKSVKTRRFKQRSSRILGRYIRGLKRFQHWLLYIYRQRFFLTFLRRANIMFLLSSFIYRSRIIKKIYFKDEFFFNLLPLTSNNLYLFRFYNKFKNNFSFSNIYLTNNLLQGRSLIIFLKSIANSNIVNDLFLVENFYDNFPEKNLKIIDDIYEEDDLDKLFFNTFDFSMVIYEGF
jgi:hypothetical protein